jgi:hypothetical protein
MYKPTVMKNFKNKLVSILLFLGGFNRKVALSCADHNLRKYIFIGMTVPFTGFLAFIGGVDIASQITHSWLARLVAGVVLSIIIMLFDTMLIVFSKSNSKLLMALRVTASLAIAFIVAPPIPLMLSHDKVNNALNFEKSAAINVLDSAFHLKVDAIQAPIKILRDTLNARQQTFFTEGLTGHENLYEDKKDNFRRDSLSFTIEKAAADSSVRALEKIHLASKAVKEKFSFGDYVSQVQMMGKLALKDFYIGVVFFSCIIFLLIAETSPIVYKSVLNGDKEDEYNIKIAALKTKLNEKAVCEIKDMVESNSSLNAKANAVNHEENVVAINEQIIELLKNKVKQTYAAEKLLNDLIEGIDSKDPSKFPLTLGVIEAQKKLLGDDIKKPPKQEPPYQSITFSKN